MLDKTYTGLSTQEALQRLKKTGANQIAETKISNGILFLQKFWAPVPWMLEITIILEIILQKYEEALIIGILLFFNALLSFFQESRANKALMLLRSHLNIQARVLRDGKWQLIKSQDLVPDDIVHLRMGDITPADIQLISGKVMVDQSMLTGEAMPIEIDENKTAYSDSTITQGEATGKVVGTGKNTYFGKTVSLVQTAKTKSHIKDIIFKIVKYLVIFISVLAAFIIFYAFIIHLTFAEIIPFILILLISAIPVALPATFTLSTALGAIHLVKKGVLVTRLSAMEEASVLDVVCVDKTGTITENKLKVAALYAMPHYSNELLLRYAQLASDESTQDPIDKAILSTKPQHVLQNNIKKLQFIPFDPNSKYTQAICEEDGNLLNIIKGAIYALTKLTKMPSEVKSVANKWGALGYRVLAVAISIGDNEFSIVGLIGLQDPPREDSKTVIGKLKEFGLRLLMLTGDDPVTAKTVAEQVDIGKTVCSADQINQKKFSIISHCEVFANLFPQDKFNLVKNLQQNGYIVGMTGDGVNDAPSLKQAEVGIAVADASDVAKAAASIVLTKPGLSGILSAVETSKRIYQRMQTYIINKISKSVEIPIFLTLGIILSNELILTPLLMVLLMFSNDFVTMAIATDNASIASKSGHWNIRNLMIAGGFIGGITLLLSLLAFCVAKFYLHLNLAELQTFVFLLLVFTAQSNVYVIRERHYFWHSCPSKWMLFSSMADIIIIGLMAANGILMTAISPIIIIGLLAAVLIYFLMADFAKVHIFKYFNL